MDSAAETWSFTMVMKEQDQAQLRLDLEAEVAPPMPCERQAELEKVLVELLLGVARARNGRSEGRSDHEVTEAD